MPITNKHLTAKLTFQMSEAHRNRLQRAAKKQKITVAELLRQLTSKP